MFKTVALILVFALSVSLCLAQEYQPLSQYEPKTPLYNPETVAKYSSYNLTYYAMGHDQMGTVMVLVVAGVLVVVTILLVVLVADAQGHHMD